MAPDEVLHLLSIDRLLPQTRFTWGEGTVWGSAYMGLLQYVPGGLGSPRTRSHFGGKEHTAKRRNRPFSDGRGNRDSSREGAGRFRDVQLGSGELVGCNASVKHRTSGTRR